MTGAQKLTLLMAAIGVNVGETMGKLIAGELDAELEMAAKAFGIQDEDETEAGDAPN